ncbi:hypothetical protein Tco_0493935 [Tanacetum coccineum]
MAESSSHNTSSPEITPKEEPVTLDKPESPNPFLPANQVEFTFEEIALPPTMKLHFYIPHTLTNNTLRMCSGRFTKLIWEDLIHKLNKKTKEKIVPYPRFISLLLEHKMPEYDNEELTINPTQAIYKLDVLVISKALKPSSQTKEVPQGKKPGAKSKFRRKQSSKHTSESQTEASKSKTGQSEIETMSISSKDKRPSHLSPPTLVVGEMHKETQQATGGPTSLGASSEERAHPQLSSGHDASAYSTTEADPGLSAPNDSISS